MHCSAFVDTHINQITQQ